MQNETKFIEGLYVKDAPLDWMACKLGIQVDRFCEFVKANKNENGYCDIDICLSKGGRLYAKLNEYQPPSNQATPPDQQPRYELPAQTAPPAMAALDENGDEVDLPF